MSASATDDPNFTTAPGWGWATFLLPYIDQAPIFNQLQAAITSNTPITDPSVASAIQTQISMYHCPSDATPLGGAFAVLVQAHAHLVNPSSDSDGGLDDLSSLHPGGINVLFADGSVHFVQSTGPDPNPGDPGAIQSTYPPPLGTPSNWYSPASYNFMGYGTIAAGEVTTPID